MNGHGMNAHSDDQVRLLELASCDVALARLNRELADMPQRSEVAAVEQQIRDISPQRLAAIERREEISAEVSKVESDIALVQARIDRDTAIEASGGTAKDLQAIEHELVSLRERKTILEDVELQILQRLEDVDRELSEMNNRDTELQQTLANVHTSLREAEQELNTRILLQQDARSLLVANLPAQLIALYDQQRSRGGVGAALLRRRTCGGCNIELPHADLERIRLAATDAVVQCPECSCILVRTDESGLS